MFLFITILLIISIVDIISLIKSNKKNTLILYITLNIIVLIFGIYYYTEPIIRGFAKVIMNM